MYKKGFTLVELMLVMAIMAILMIVVMGILNPNALVNRGKDARRKKDIGRIKVALEEYMNDNGCYPTQTIVDALQDESNCGKTVANFPQLAPWICDPNGNVYTILVEEVSCPHWFKILTRLEDKDDVDIPADWYVNPSAYHLGGGSLTGEDVNYGMSSTNINWYEYELDSSCTTEGDCYSITGSGNPPPCGAVTSCTGANCYRSNSCKAICKVKCCGGSCSL